MEFPGKLKDQAETLKEKEQAKEMTEKAGIQLEDEELNQVAGGRIRPTPLTFPPFEP